LTEPDRPLYTSRIIKASALISDTRLLLAEWDLSRPAAENIADAHRRNILGKSSRKRAKDVLQIFRQRYFDDPDVGATLVTLTQRGAPAQWIDPLLYFFSAQNDSTLRDLVIEVLYPRHRAGDTDLPVGVVLGAIHTWVAEGKTTSRWGEKTILRVARNSMAALRDFGILQGKAKKRLAPVYLPVPTFALMALWLQRRERSGYRVLHSDEWKLFFLPIEGVERYFIEADQQHLLTYQAAGSVIRIEFPAATMREYADVLLERAEEAG